MDEEKEIDVPSYQEGFDDGKRYMAELIREWIQDYGK